jgi:predicted nucleic acid-binding protein
MDARAIVDSGFVVALSNTADAHHQWALEQLPTLPGPWLTAEACVSEAMFLFENAANGRNGVSNLFRSLEQGRLMSQHLLPEETSAVAAEITRYQDRWVDFADACIVRLSDRNPELPVASVDRRDFSVYFRSRPDRDVRLPPESRQKRR